MMKKYFMKEYSFSYWNTKITQNMSGAACNSSEISAVKAEAGEF